MREELSMKIEARNSESRLSRKEDYVDGELLSTIKSLQVELDDLKISNVKLRSDNEFMQAKLSSLELSTPVQNNFSEPPTDYHHQHIPNFVRVVQIDDDERDPRNFERLNEAIYSEGFSFSHMAKKSKVQNSSKSQYKELQKKIDKLKSENAGLRKHLYH